MKKSEVVTSLVLVAGIAAYLIWAYPRLPDSVPLRFSMSNVPVAFGTRQAFVALPAAAAVILFSLFLASARNLPKTAFLSMVALALLLFFVHVRVQAVLAAFWPVPENLAVFVAVATLAVGVAGVFVFRRPPPKRVNPF